MITFHLNGNIIEYEGDDNISLLNFLRETQGIYSVKDGCSGQAACGACMVEIDGKAKLSCVTKIKTLNGSKVFTLEGIPISVLLVLAKAFVTKGAVQCGFCSPGFLMRTKVLFQENPHPTRQEIAVALKHNLCRCTGYVKIIDAIELALKKLRNYDYDFDPEKDQFTPHFTDKYKALQMATGLLPFVNDMHPEGTLHAALRFSDHPRAVILSMDTRKAMQLKGVHSQD